MNGEGDNFQKGELLIYQTEDGKTKIDVFFEDDTIWLNQKQIAQLYQKGVNTINEHIKHIYEDEELDEQATIRKFLIVRNEGNREISISVLPKSVSIRRCTIKGRIPDYLLRNSHYFVKEDGIVA